MKDFYGVWIIFWKKETENTLLNARHEFLAKMQKNSFSPTKLMQLEVMGDFKNSSWPVLYLSQPQLGLIKEYLDKVYKSNKLDQECWSRLLEYCFTLPCVPKATEILFLDQACQHIDFSGPSMSKYYFPDQGYLNTFLLIQPAIYCCWTKHAKVLFSWPRETK